jgi:hypothetical protein
MCAKIGAGIALIIGAGILRLLIQLGYFSDCAPRFDFRPVNHICLPVILVDSMLAIEIFMLLGGIVLIVLGAWSRKKSHIELRLQQS